MAVYDKFDNSLMANLVGVSYAGKPKDNTMMYITKKVEHLLLNLKDTKNALVFLEKGIDIPEFMVKENNYVFCADPAKEYTSVALELAKKRDDKLRQMKYTLTGGGYWLGENVEIGENTYIEPGVLIDHNVKIGKSVIIKAGAKIRFDSVIGDNCSIGENTVIGEPGFNIAESDNGKTVIMPNFGSVRIGNFVDIGANTSISKGTADSTTIGDFVKIDSNVRIGHDVKLCEYVEVRGGACVSGYVNIGTKTVVCVGACIKNRINVGGECVVGMGAVLTNNVRDGVTVKGDPAISLEKFGQYKVFEMELKGLLRRSKRDNVFS